MSWCVAAMACGPAIDTRYISTVAGTPAVVAPEMWLQGDVIEVTYRWPNAYYCNFDEWFCENPRGLTTTVLAASCTGCSFVDDPTGRTAPSEQRGTFRATTAQDGPVRVELRLRFDATGATQGVAATAVGEHEAGLVATCGLVPRAELPATGDFVRTDAIRSCTAPRAATDAVIVTPRIRLASGAVYFPWCLDWFCQSRGDQARPVTAIGTSLAIERWWSMSAGLPYQYFFVVTAPGDGGTLRLTAPLLHGPMAETGLELPKIAEAP